MAYEQVLADRVRDVLVGERGLAEKPMFGGLAFLVEGSMAVSASSKGGLLLRCDPSDTEDLVSEPHVERFEMRGKAMDGWLHVHEHAVQSDEELRRWVAVGVAYARSLTPTPSNASSTSASFRPHQG